MYANNFTLIQALRTTILHHLGTVAFGSLIIAIIRTIRAVVSYFQRKLKKTHNKVLGCGDDVVALMPLCLQTYLRVVIQLRL